MFARPTIPVAAALCYFRPGSSRPRGKPQQHTPSWYATSRSDGKCSSLLPLVVVGVSRIAGRGCDGQHQQPAAGRRAPVLPAITKPLSALESPCWPARLDTWRAQKNFTARKYELQTRLADTDVIADVRSGVSALLNGGQALLDKVLADIGAGIGYRLRAAAVDGPERELTRRCGLTAGENPDRCGFGPGRWRPRADDDGRSWARGRRRAQLRRDGYPGRHRTTRRCSG